MSAAASILSIYHTLPNDLAVTNLNIEPRGVDFYFSHTLHYGLGRGNPDAVPKPQFQKKTHGLANARGLTRAEVAALELKVRGELARTVAIVTPEAEVI